MSGFSRLWQKSLALDTAEDAQAFVRSHFEAVCRENRLDFWPCGEGGQRPAGSHLFLGVATYDRNDLELLDEIGAGLAAGKSRFGRVHLFCLTACKSASAIGRVVPDFERFAGQNPIVSVWLDEQCVFPKGGWAARQWLRDAFRVAAAGDDLEGCDTIDFDGSRFPDYP